MDDFFTALIAAQRLSCRRAQAASSEFSGAPCSIARTGEVLNANRWRACNESLGRIMPKLSPLHFVNRMITDMYHSGHAVQAPTLVSHVYSNLAFQCLAPGTGLCPGPDANIVSFSLFQRIGTRTKSNRTNRFRKCYSMNHEDFPKKTADISKLFLSTVSLKAACDRL